jgi:hypothetical protein
MLIIYETILTVWKIHAFENVSTETGAATAEYTLSSEHNFLLLKKIP